VVLAATDQELLRATAGGDGSAFGQLVERHAQDLFRLAQWLSPNRADAEDVLQETLAGAFKAAKSFDGRSTVKTWITGIMIRQAARFRRKHKNAQRTVSLHAPDGVRPAASLDRAAPSAVASIDRRIDLAQVIDTLAEEHREVILLREAQGLSYDEIAAVLGVPQGTVESRLYRARASLRKKLEGYVKVT